MNPLQQVIKQRSEEFVEKGADLEHERWAGWQKYLHSLCIKNEDGTLTIPKERVERWERQIKTPYSELSEQEKEYDRIEVRKYLPHNQEIVEAILEAVHAHLVSEEARMAMEGINSDFENGYFEAIDDIAKFISSTLQDIKNNK